MESILAVLVNKSIQQIEGLKFTFERSVLGVLYTDHRLLGIQGPRGTGKTTLLLQYAKKQPDYQTEVLYASLDNFWFATNTLYDLADAFSRKGGQILLLDEVHKYPNWAQELKNIYDDYPELRVIFTGSSLLDIPNARADLSRRAVVYSIQGLSFREYVALEAGIELPLVQWDTLLSNHLDIATDVIKIFKPFQYFEHYLRIGYYPFFKESKALYFDKLDSVVNLILEVELPQLRKFDVAYIAKIKQLLAVLAASTPFTPNVSKLSERIGINRITLLQYMHFLEESGLLINLFKKGQGISQFQKPNKLYLDNCNLALMLNTSTDVGTLRETFFANQVRPGHTLHLPDSGDFLVDETYTFEIGGRSESRKQIKSSPHSFLVLDDMEYGARGTIPLWMFGLMY